MKNSCFDKTNKTCLRGLLRYSFEVPILQYFSSRSTVICTKWKWQEKQKRLPLNNSLINLFAKNLRDINCQKMKHILNFDKAMKNNYEYKTCLKIEPPPHKIRELQSSPRGVIFWNFGKTNLKRSERLELIAYLSSQVNKRFQAKLRLPKGT